MTVAAFCELVLLRVTGGQPSTDNSVMLVDIKAMLPAAANYAMDKTYNLNLQSEGDRDIQGAFYAQYDDVPILRDAKIPYIELVTGVVPLKVGAGIRFVYDDCGGQYAPLADADMNTIKYYGNQLTDMKWYRQIGRKLELWGVNPIADKLNYQSIKRIEDLADSDELPLQAGAEKDVLDILVDWFTGQRKMPYDNLINTKDINAAQ